MYIAKLSIGLSQMKITQQASVYVLKMAMNAGQAQMDDLLQMAQQNTKAMEQSRSPYLGVSTHLHLEILKERASWHIKEKKKR